MPSSRVPAWPECAALPAGFASGADLGREGDVAALRDALAELSRARATCASSLARGLDAPDLRARARERASWTTLVASNAPAPPTSTARGDASGAAPPPTTRISRRMARSGATTLRRAPLPVPPRPRTRARARNPPRCARSLPPGIPRRRRRGRRRRRRHPGRGSRSVRRRDEGRNVEVHLCRVQTTATRVRERALRGSPRDSIGERASTRGATLLLPRATLPLPRRLPRRAGERLPPTRILATSRRVFPRRIRRVRRRETRRRGTDTSDDDGSGRGPRRERADTRGDPPAIGSDRSAIGFDDRAAENHPRLVVGKKIKTLRSRRNPPGLRRDARGRNPRGGREDTGRGWWPTHSIQRRRDGADARARRRGRRRRDCGRRGTRRRRARGRLSRVVHDVRASRQVRGIVRSGRRRLSRCFGRRSERRRRRAPRRLRR